MTDTLARPARAGRTKRALIDCDIHNSVPADALQPYLPAEWREYEREIGGRGPSVASTRRASPTRPGPTPSAQRSAARRRPAVPARAAPRRLGHRLRILNCLHGGGQLNARWGAAQARAVNDWQVAEWLDPEPRLRASIVVHPGDPRRPRARSPAARKDPRFVQVLLTVRTAEPLGKPRYWPLYAAAAEHGLPVGIHFGGPAPNPITPTGWPSYYLEDHSGMMLAFQAQVASFVYEGAFQRFPTCGSS